MTEVTTWNQTRYIFHTLQQFLHSLSIHIILHTDTHDTGVLHKHVHDRNSYS
jgi:hypothetical protein